MLRGLAIAAALLAGAPARAAGDCPALPRREPMPAEAVPSEPWWSDWHGQVAAIAARLPGEALATRQLVFIGDSITAGWDPGLFAQFYGQRAPLLLGVIGDATQGVLARLPGELGQMRPRAAVLLIGTNNLGGGGKPADVALGVAEIVRAVHARSPATRLLIVGVLPRGADASDPLRAAVTRTNELLARCADGQTVFYTDIGRLLLNGDGQLSAEISFDHLHLTPVGYGIMAAALEPEIRRMLGQ